MSDETSKVTYPLYSKNTFAYGSGNFFATMNPLMQNTFIAFFFSTILLFDSIAVGGMLTVARVINMIAVPCIGILMQKSNPKMGRIRFWLMFSLIASIPFYILQFTPLNLSGTGGFWFYSLMYGAALVIFNLGYVSYGAAINIFAQHPQELTNCSTVRSQCNSAGKIFFGFVSTGIIAGIGAMFANEGFGYTGLAVLILVFMFIGYTPVIRRLKRDEVYIPTPKEPVEKQKQTSPADMLKSIFTRPVLTWFFGNCMANLSFYIILSLASYYFIYVANSKAMMGTFFGMNNALVFVGALTAPWIAKFFKWDGRKVYIYGLCMTCICALLTFLFGKTAVMFAVLLALCSVGFGSCMSVDIAVIGNIAQCLSIEKKKDVSTFIFSLSFIPANLATIFQGLILGFGLHIIGFDPAMQAASDAFVNGLRVIMSLFPAIATAIGIVGMWLYPYSEKRMIEITASESKAV